MWIAIIIITLWFIFSGFNFAVVKRIEIKGYDKDKSGYYVLAMSGPFFTIVWVSMLSFNKLLGYIDPKVEELIVRYNELAERHKDLQTERDSLIIAQMSEALEVEDAN
jgi:hypothetical protein